jgi:hypothetical protein
MAETKKAERRSALEIWRCRAGRYLGVKSMASTIRLISCLEETHAMFLGGDEGATDVTHLLSLGSHFLAEIDGGFLRGSELIHLNSGQITVNHVYGH